MIKKEIIIDEKHMEKITEILNDVQKKCKARKIDFNDIINVTKKVEKHLDIKKKDLEGIQITVDVNAQEFPNAYKYIPYSTFFNAIYRNKKWRLTDVYREMTNRRYAVNIKLTDVAKNAIIANKSVIDRF